MVCVCLCVCVRVFMYCCVACFKGSNVLCGGEPQASQEERISSWSYQRSICCDPRGRNKEQTKVNETMHTCTCIYFIVVYQFEWHWICQGRTVKDSRNSTIWCCDIKTWSGGRGHTCNQRSSYPHDFDQQCQWWYEAPHQQLDVQCRRTSKQLGNIMYVLLMQVYIM